MLSDESSSDSETGRFKCRTKNEDEQKKTSHKNDIRSSDSRSRPASYQIRKEFDRKRDDRNRHDRRSRERHTYSRQSPVRRRPSRDRSPNRRSREKERDRPRHQVESRPKEPARERSKSKDRRHSRSRSHRSPEQRRDMKDELRRHIREEVKPTEHRRDLKDELRRHLKDEVKLKDNRREIKEELKRHIKEEVKPAEHRRDLKDESRRHVKEEVPPKERNTRNYDRKSRDKSSSPDYKGKRSVIQKPVTSQKRQSRSPIVIEEHDSGTSEEVQLGSYYSMIPAVVKDKGESPKPITLKEKSEESSEIDSSDDERLRAKLLNLEKELHKTRKKKHKRKHKKKGSKSSKDREHEPATVEVSSTTDIDKAHVTNAQTESAEVTSTQKNTQKESSEEGEITSDDDSQQGYEIDPTDLRHKLKKSTCKTSDERVSSNLETCGPALPPHLQKKYKRSKSPEIEGPALPPNLKGHSNKNIGPSIPDDLRKVLAEREHDDVKYVSSDEDIGIGPLPVGAEDKWSDAHKRLEERALDIKIKKLDGRSVEKSDVKSREQWMLELPEAKAKILGLEARSFRAKAGPDMSDRSSWTDTPEEKVRKAAGVEREEDPEVALQREARARHITSRDEEQEKAVKKHKKKHKREESLLEMHEKKLKKKKKKEEKEDKAERRPFSRDVDLQVNRFDEAQKKSIIKKAQDLNSRFGRGEAKFL